MSSKYQPRVVHLDPAQPCARCGQPATVGTVEPLPNAAAQQAAGGLLLLPMCQVCLERMTSGDSDIYGDGTALSA